MKKKCDCDVNKVTVETKAAQGLHSKIQTSLDLYTQEDSDDVSSCR
jgi:hypothetical protein